MKIAICDDNTQVLNTITQYIDSYFFRYKLQTPECYTFSCGEDLLKSTLSFDLLFLDIEMPGLNGIFVGNELKKHNPNLIIIIVTSFMEYLDDAMRFHVFRYISKPIDQNRFDRNMTDALKVFSSRTYSIGIETKEGIQKINCSDIISVENITRKVIIHTTKGDIDVLNSFTSLENKLPANSFFKTHRSYIVNLAFVNNFDKSLVYLNNNTITAYLTRRKYTQFKNTFLLYLESMR